MQIPNDIESVFQIADDSAKARADEFFERADRRRQVEFAVLGRWHNAAYATPENRNLLMLAARAGLRQYLFEETLVALMNPPVKEPSR